MHHHERLEGSGNPFRLAGSEISIETRILSVADAYAVIRDGRPYAPGLSRVETLAKLSCLTHLFDVDVLHELDRVEPAVLAA